MLLQTAVVDFQRFLTSGGNSDHSFQTLDHDAGPGSGMARTVRNALVRVAMDPGRSDGSQGMSTTWYFAPPSGERSNRRRPSPSGPLSDERSDFAGEPVGPVFATVDRIAPYRTAAHRAAR